MRPVLSKPDFYSRWHSGEFGNRLRSWDTWGELLLSDFEGPIGIRNTMPGGKFVCPIPFGQWHIEREKLLAEGVAKETMRFGEAAPDDHVKFQAEVMRTWRGLEMRYVLGSGKTHREAMKTAEDVCGLSALYIFRHEVEPTDVADIEALLELYPNHVIEFSTYAFPVGNIPGRCTLIWEVRAY